MAVPWALFLDILASARWTATSARSSVVFFSVLLRFSLSAIKRHELGQNGYHFSGILRGLFSNRFGLFSNRFDLFSNRFDLVHDAFTAAPLNHRGAMNV